MADREQDRTLMRHRCFAMVILGAMAAALILIRYGAVLFDGDLADETTYIKAADAVRAGHDPYLVTGYLYPPSFAVVAAFLRGLMGEQHLRIGLRLFNLVFGVAAVLCALWIASPPRKTRALIAFLLILVWPPLVAGMAVGNLSPLISGMVILGVCLFPRRPAAAAFLLAVSVCLKPIGLAGLLMVILHGLKTMPRKNGFIGGAVAILVGTAALLLSRPYLAEMVSLSRLQQTALGNISIYRICFLMGLEVSPFVIASIVVGAGGVFAWRAPRDQRLLLCAVACCSTLSMPVVWQHSLLLALPLQVCALEIAISRYLAERSVRRVMDALLVTAGVIAVTYAEAWGGFNMLQRSVQAILVSMPVLALLGLIGYLLGTASAPRGDRTTAGIDAPAASARSDPGERSH